MTVGCCCCCLFEQAVTVYKVTKLQRFLSHAHGATGPRILKIDLIVDSRW